MKCRLPILILPIALIAACKDKGENDRRTASGQVLEGTISDEMLPLDTVTSQPPLMKAEVKKTATGADGTAAAEEVPTGEVAPEEATAEVTSDPVAD